jgi:hypothetical protein
MAICSRWCVRVVWCGVVFERWIIPEEADADLRGLARLN